MNFNELKRKVFFWVEKLQISRNERVAFVLLMAILTVLLSLSYFLQSQYQYHQEEYDKIIAEFERRSALIEQQQKEQAAKYLPAPTVDNIEEKPSSETQIVTTESNSNSDPEETTTQVLININTASSAELQKLHGIGPSYAQNIIDYREANGGFDSIDELINVKGIGKKRLENIRPYIKLEK